MSDTSDIVAALRTLRVNHVDLERSLQDDIAGVLAAAGIAFERERFISPRCRVDFLCSGVVIEVKKGKPNSRMLADQVRRYAACADVVAVIIVVERCTFEHDREACGKPVHYLSLSKLWGISL